MPIQMEVCLAINNQLSWLDLRIKWHWLQQRLESDETIVGPTVNQGN